MEPNLINESRLFDELAELFLHISNTFAQLASHRRNASNSVSPKSNAIPSNSWDIPQKGKYNQVREYIKVRKKEDPALSKGRRGQGAAQAPHVPVRPP